MQRGIRHQDLGPTLPQRTKSTVAWAPCSWLIFSCRPARHATGTIHLAVGPAFVPTLRKDVSLSLLAWHPDSTGHATVFVTGFILRKVFYTAATQHRPSLLATIGCVDHHGDLG
jgi:hypothetical protein